MGIIRTNLNFKEIAKQVHDLEKKLDTEEKIDAFINKHIYGNEPTADEMINKLKNNEIIGSLDYPVEMQKYQNTK